MSEPHQEYSMQYLQYAEQLNRTSIGKKIMEDQLSHQRQMNELLIREKETHLKVLDTALQSQRENMRPHRLNDTFVAYDPVEGKYRCQLGFGIDEDEDDQPITAYGQTAAQACENFDHLWLYGEHNE